MRFCERIASSLWEWRQEDVTQRLRRFQPPTVRVCRLHNIRTALLG